MKNLKQLFIILALAVMFFIPVNKANAITASTIADKTIHYTAKAAYLTTKYTLKASFFIIKKTAKGIKVISKSLYHAAKDASKSSPKKSNYNYRGPEMLPPVPDYEVPSVINVKPPNANNLKLPSGK